MGIRLYWINLSIKKVIASCVAFGSLRVRLKCSWLVRKFIKSYKRCKYSTYYNMKMFTSEDCLNN